MNIKFLRSFSIACLIAGVLILPLAALAQSGTIFVVTNVDASQFPQVQFQLRAADLNNQAVTGLNSTNLSVYENGQLVSDVQVTQRDDGPVNVIFVIDQGSLTNYTFFGVDKARLAITTLVSGGYFKDGVDTAMVLVRENVNSDVTTTYLPATQTGSELTTWAANHNFNRSRGGKTKGLLGVDDAITEMGKLVTIPASETTAIVLLTRTIEDPTASIALQAAQNVAARAKSQNISLYVFQTDTFNANSLQTLATSATGSYTRIRGSTVVADVSNVYQLINSQRTVYTVSYRSPLGQSGVRQITINSAQATGQGTPGSYEITLDPPAVTISEPFPDSTIRREAQPSADNTNIVFDTNVVAVAADVSWPGNPRVIKSVELLVDDEVRDTITPLGGETHFEFQWDITDIITEGVNPVTIQVKVTDELGVEGASPVIPLQVEVVPPPPTPTPDPSAQFMTTVTTTASQYWVALPIICLGLLCVIPFSFLIFYMTRPTQARKVVEDIRHTLIGGAPMKQKSLGAIQVVEGPRGMIGEKLDITKPITTIGRNPKMVDIVFYAEEESSVSRLHCTIQLDGRTFKLTDNNSTSGTRVNGRRIQPNDPVELHDGDEIVLGDLAKLGVKLKFGVMMDKTQLQSSGTASDKTFIMDDFDHDDWDKYKDN